MNICLNSKLRIKKGRRGRDRIVIGLPMQSVPITTDVVSSNLDRGEMYNSSVVFPGYSGFFRHDIAEILLKIALSTIKQTSVMKRCGHESIFPVFVKYQCDDRIK